MSCIYRQKRTDNLVNDKAINRFGMRRNTRHNETLREEMHRLPATPWLLTPAIVAGLGLMAGIALASEPLILDSKEPKDLNELRARAEQVRAAYDAAAFGGVLPDEEVGEELGDGVAAVTGLPGWTGQPLGDIRSGLGVKETSGGQFDDGFQFPETTTGFSTRCPLKTSALRKTVQAYDLLSYVRFPLVNAPYFEDPPCLTTPGDCEDFCRELNTFTYPDCAVLKGDEQRGIGCALWCEKNTCTDGWTDICNTSLSALTGGAVPDSPQVPELSLYQGNLVFEKDGVFVYHETLEPAYNEDGYPITFGETEEYNEPIDLTPPEPSYPNCTPCKGEECRCSLQPVPEPDKNPICLLQVPDIDVGRPSMANIDSDMEELLSGCRLASLRSVEADDREFSGDQVIGLSDCLSNMDGGTEGLEEGVYASFFRQYQAFATRRAFTNVAPNDQNEKEARVACYGFYDEYDPSLRETIMTRYDPPVGEEQESGTDEDSRIPQDARCVIDLDAENFPETQLGTGEEPESPLADSFSPYARESSSDSPWYGKLGGAFSLMHSDDDQMIDTLAKSVLTLKESDTAGLHALPALHRATIPDFDETGPHRTVVDWWTHLQSVFGEAFSQPVAHLLLPKVPNVTLSPDDPLFDDSIPEHAPSTDPTAPFEVQLGVGEDLAGRVAAFLERDLLFRVEEEPMPVLVPAGSPDDWRALAQSWCTYVTSEAVGKKDCTSIQPLVDKLEEYAVRIEEVAGLRAELSKTLTSLLDAREDSLDAIDDWRSEAEKQLQPALEDLERLDDLRQRWNDLTLRYAEVGAITNMPWPMNQRFTLPILWLLDPWLPSRHEAGLISMRDLPLPQLSARPADLELNFSLLDLHQGRIAVPVLRPSQVTLDLVRLSPPGTGESQTTEPPKLPEFPSLDPIKNALNAARQSLAEVSVISEPPLPEVPEYLSAEREQELTAALENSESVIDGMDDAYHRFWDPLLPEFDAEREALSCQYWGEGICLYSEMELTETLMRMMSRVGALLKEDLAVLAPFGRKTSTACPFNDGGCLPLPPVERPRPEGWQIVAPASDDSEVMNESRRTIRETMLPEELNEPRATELKSIPWSYSGPDLLPGLAIPTAIDLIPASSSSAFGDF